MDVESVAVKRPRKAAALKEGGTGALERARKLTEEFRKMMATPLTEDELRERKETRERLLSETWEMFRDNWVYGNVPFDAVTTIPCMRFTDADLEDHDYPYNISPMDTLQIVSVQVKALTAALQLPLDVYGFIAIHDVLDRKRIMVFDRQRKDCQTINEQDSYLRLTGPSRGVLINNDPSYLEVVLKVKGLTESEDKDLNKFATTYRLGRVDPIEYTSKLCTLELQHYPVLLSVEATISVRVFQGQWPPGFRGVINAATAGREDIQIGLSDLNDDELHVDADGFIKLARRVVSVERDGKLGVSLWENDVGEEGAVWVAAEKSGRATHYMPVKKFSLWLEVTVAWSLF